LLGGAFFYVFVYCAAHKTLAKQLAVERRVKHAAQRPASAGAGFIGDPLDAVVNRSYRFEYAA
jgi:hypothetical protein